MAYRITDGIPHAHICLQHNKQPPVAKANVTPFEDAQLCGRYVADCAAHSALTQFSISRCYKVSSPCSFFTPKIHSVTSSITSRHPTEIPFLQWTLSLPLLPRLSSTFPHPQNPENRRQTPELNTRDTGVLGIVTASSLTARWGTTQNLDTIMRGMAGLGTATASLHEDLVNPSYFLILISTIF